VNNDLRRFIQLFANDCVFCVGLGSKSFWSLREEFSWDRVFVSKATVIRMVCEAI
jgi:hypothetical protein